MCPSLPCWRVRNSANDYRDKRGVRSGSVMHRSVPKHRIANMRRSPGRARDRSTDWTGLSIVVAPACAIIGNRQMGDSLRTMINRFAMASAEERKPNESGIARVRALIEEELPF